jgi:hypothetical protein
METRVVAGDAGRQTEVLAGTARMEMKGPDSFEVLAKSADGKTHVVRTTSSRLEASRICNTINRDTS